MSEDVLNQPESYRPQQPKKNVEAMQKLLQKNDTVAAQNRRFLAQKGIVGFNIMGSPGSGKTTLLEQLIKTYDGDLTGDGGDLKGDVSEIAVLEGDLETSRDAERIRKQGVQAHQICTGSVCHLSAGMVAESLKQLNLDKVRLLFIENVGNLVCPSKFDLGTTTNIVAISIPEGDDKPIKYPVMIRMADVVVLTKTDLLTYFDFDVERCCREIKEINPKVVILETALSEPDGFRALWAYITKVLEKNRSGCADA